MSEDFKMMKNVTKNSQRIGAILWRLLDRNHDNSLNYSKYTFFNIGFKKVPKNWELTCRKRNGWPFFTGSSTLTRKKSIEMISWGFWIFKKKEKELLQPAKLISSNLKSKFIKELKKIDWGPSESNKLSKKSCSLYLFWIVLTIEKLWRKNTFLLSILRRKNTWKEKLVILSPKAWWSM